MKQTLGFLRWHFRGAFKSLSFYGLLTVFLSVAMTVGGCPAPWPMRVLVLGISMSLLDAAIAYYRFSRALYEMEQNRIMRELKKD